MKIYTKTGDGGDTGLYGGLRVAKDSLLVDAYGTVDELNAALGVARALSLSQTIISLLTRIQGDLFRLGAEVSCAPESVSKLGIETVSEADIGRLEQAIDEAEARLPPLKTFLLPGGCHAAAALHQARTVCRRAERALVSAVREQARRPELVVYLNRLGDLLFVLARAENQEQEVEDIPWLGRHE